MAYKSIQQKQVTKRSSTHYTRNDEESLWKRKLKN